MPPPDLPRTMRQQPGRRRSSPLSSSPPPLLRPPLPSLPMPPRTRKLTLPSTSTSAGVCFVSRRGRRGTHSSLVVVLASLVGVAAAAVGAAAVAGAIPSAVHPRAASTAMAEATSAEAAPVTRTTPANAASAAHSVVDATNRLGVSSLTAAIVIEIEVEWVNKGKHPGKHNGSQPCRKSGDTQAQDDPGDEPLPECILPTPQPSLTPPQPMPLPPHKASPTPTAPPVASSPKPKATPKRTTPPQRTASPKTTSPGWQPQPSADPPLSKPPTSTRTPPTTSTQLPRPCPAHHPSVSPDRPDPSPSVQPVPPTAGEEPVETSEANSPSGVVVGSLPPPPPSPNNDDSSASTTANDGGVPLGAIVGGSIGGVALVGALVGAVLLSGRRRATTSNPAEVEAGAPTHSTGRDRSGGEWSAPPMPLTRGAVGSGGDGTDPPPADGFVADADGRPSDADVATAALAVGGRGPVPPMSAEDAAAVAAAATTATATTAAMMAADETDSDSSSVLPSDWEVDEDSDERFPRASVGGGVDLGPTTRSSAGEALTFDYIMGAGEATTRSQGRRLRRAAAAGEGDPMAVLGAGGSLASLGASASSLRMDNDGED